MGHADLSGTILAAATAYREDVEAGRFPGLAETSRMDDAVLDEVLGRSPLDRETSAGQSAGRDGSMPASGIPLDRDL